MEYTIKRTNRKTLAISIVDGEVIIRSPKNLSQNIIDEFVKAKASWIKEKVESYRPKGVDLQKDTLRVFGETKALNIYQASSFSMKMNESINVFTRNISNLEKLEKKIEDAFKNPLEKYIDKRVTYYANLLKIDIPPFKIRRYKRMYGRCNQKGELAFNLYLFHESYDFIDYVVLHECAHILEFNHSKAFYNIIERHMPNYKEIIRLNKL